MSAQEDMKHVKRCMPRWCELNRRVIADEGCVSAHLLKLSVESST